MTCAGETATTPGSAASDLPTAAAFVASPVSATIVSWPL